MRLRLAAAALFLASGALAQAPDAAEPKIRAKTRETKAERRLTARDGGMQPDTEVIDAPTTAVLDNYGYQSRSRFYSRGGLLQYLAFGVYPGVNLGASIAADGLIGDERRVRLRAPTAQVKWRFYEGDNQLPSLAVGFDGQGYKYNAGSRRFNQRQRGFYLVASQELGAPGVQLHPGFNISDFDSNAIFGTIPLTVNIRDKVSILAEWDNIANWSDSRLNSGLRAYVTQNFHVDFAVRSIGGGGWYSDGQPRGAERIVQLRYHNSF